MTQENSVMQNFSQLKSPDYSKAKIITSKDVMNGIQEEDDEDHKVGPNIFNEENDQNTDRAENKINKNLN